MISQIMHPKLQISAGVEQDFEPKSTSGARYHRVATPYVRAGLFQLGCSDLTNPKSHSLIVQFEFTSILDGFKSRCIMAAECRYFKAFASWQTINLICTSLSIPSLITLCRSASMNSKSRQTSLLLSARMVSWSLMMLGCSSCFRIQIQRQVRWASVACWKASKIFFRAITCFVPLSYTFHT